MRSWWLLLLMVGCAMPSAMSSEHSCSEDARCSQGEVCYRGFCLASDDASGPVYDADVRPEPFGEGNPVIRADGGFIQTGDDAKGPQTDAGAEVHDADATTDAPNEDASTEPAPSPAPSPPEPVPAPTPPMPTPTPVPMPPPMRFTARINFQPADAPVPAGYGADSGAVFGKRANGLSYGWNAKTSETRDRNNASSADQRYDTLNHMQNASNSNGRWEIALPNGDYDVRVVMGDPNFFDSVFRLNAENTQILSATLTKSRRWAEATALVRVTDGRLTLSNGSGAKNNKLCFIEITAR